ncbi:unnamed protein product [Clavelina lepadiformis]|uniref:Leucine-, glutamate- and lysine-rich protein 1 n=1 Tax=Clavelina lepadiformis TaxID=159417 RepID=A0ABP0FDP0_CLALP
MKSAKVRSLSPIMERHTPQHPLPDEIKKLPQGETVCHFCGVSYLIHHEIKKLEDLVAQLEEELEERRGAVVREQKLKMELDKNKSAIEIMNKLIAEKDSTIEKITRAVEETKSENEHLSEVIIKEKLKTDEAKQALRNYKKEIAVKLLNFQNASRLLKTDLCGLHEEVKTNKNQLNSHLAELFSKLPLLSAACSAEYLSALNTDKELNASIQSMESDLQYWQSKCAATEKEMTNLKNDFEFYKTNKAASGENLKKQLTDLQNVNRELSKSVKAAEMLAKSTQADTALLEEKLRKKQTELQNATIKLQKTEDNADRTIQRLNQDCRDLEKELASVEEELKKMSLEQKAREKKELELSRTASLNSSHLVEMENALAEAKATNKSLMEERELMVTSHQNQIQQLRESFKRKLEASEGLPVKAQKELQLAEDRHRENMSALEQKLRDEFKIELCVEKDKHTESILTLKNKHKIELNKQIAGLQKEINPLQTEIATLQQKVEILTKNTQEKETEFEEERSSLKKMLHQLEERITHMTGEQEDEVALCKLEVATVKEKYLESEKRNEDLERKTISMKEEISLLQDTVRRECEERFELTEALSHAKEHFKTCQVSNPVVASNSNNAFYPVSAVNKLNPSTIDSEQNRLSNKILRTLEMDSTASPRAPGQHLPSLRSLPDVLPRRELHHLNNNKTTPSPPSEATAISASAHVRDLSFGSVEISPKRSLSGGSQVNGHVAGKTSLFPSALPHSKSADNVDNVRRRIAAAIKRK